MINVAFAGVRHGHIYSIYDMALTHPEFEICGGFEEHEEARKAAESWGLEFKYDTLEELLSDEKVDAVALGGCFADRGQVAVKALRAGKHVIADKPLCTSLKELDEIEQLVKTTGKKVTCLYTLRFNGRILALRKLVQSGILGEISNVYFGGQHPLQYGRRPDWYFEEGKYGGVINDIAIHGIDALNFVAGMKDFSISASRCWNNYAAEQKQFKDCGQFMLVADNGAGILGDVSYSVPDGIEFKIPYYWQFHIWGTKGMISFALNDSNVVYYLAGETQPHILEKLPVEVDFMTDFYRVIQGEKDVILPVEDVINSTRRTLEIQNFADKE